MSERPLSWFILVFTLLGFAVRTQLTSYVNSHGFITNKHEKYFADDISSMHEELAAEVRNSAINLNMKYLLKFEPEFLDFKQRPLGVPHLEKVTLFNVDRNRSIDMTSISGSTVHFHSSFFEDKKIPPLGNTTFNVVFLGREEGQIESNLFIHTTEGHFKYQVKGASIYSPYRLRPIVGVKLPLNASFSPLIYMHNPHSEPIQIVEMYSSGGDFHLELPSGELEGPKDLWEISPFQTKAVIRVRLHARTEQNHTAYVRIKLNNTEEILVVPLEVEVSANGGIFAPQGYLDFGVGGSFDPPKFVKLHLHNPFKKAVRVHSITTTSEAIKIEHDHVKISSDGKNSKGETSFVEVATLKLDWKKAFQNEDYSGKIVIKYKNGKKTVLPYYLTVLEGGISCNTSSTRYFISGGNEDMKSRSVDVKNNFLTPLALMNVSLPSEADKYFQVSNFKPVILRPGETKIIFDLKMRPGVSLSNLRINSHIVLKSNVSDFELPLLSYNGKLELHLPFKSKDNSLDLGLLSLEATKDTYILLLNRNPIKVTLKQVLTSLSSSQVSVVGCSRGDHLVALLQESYLNMTKCTYLRPDDYAILKLVVQTSNTEGQIWGDISVLTQYEQMSIPFHYKAAQGKLEIGPDRLVFDPCFPGKLCSHPLKVHSTFAESMMIEDILSIPPDLRMSSKHSGQISPKVGKVVGHIYLDPNVGCQNECYTGMEPESALQWLQSLTLPSFTPEVDLNLVNVFYNRYLNQTSNGAAKWQNLTMRLDTSKVKGHLFKTRVKMTWPTLLLQESFGNKSVYNFPLTQVGNTTYRNITIKNPSSYLLLVQLVLDKFYPSVDVLYEGLPPNFIPNYSAGFKQQKHDFFIHEIHKKKKKQFEVFAKLKYHESTVPLFLNPGENFTITVGYKANEPQSHSALLFIRNNLTVLEVVRLNAQGAHPSFKFGNRKPGSTLPLVFELTDKHLKDCEREKNRKYPAPNLSVKRSFTARNTGEVTVFVSNFLVNGMECEGYGFKVLNCEAFALLPNATKKIDIAFTPDFTLAKVTRNLVLVTSLNVPVNYTLVTTIPSCYLALCASVLTRPVWETYLYIIATALMCFLLLLIVIMSVMESDRILKQTIGVITRRNVVAQPLDLRLIGAQTREEVRSGKVDDSDEKKEKTVEKSVGKESENSPKQTKQEPEKYTVLVPTTGKGKKKLSKRNSNELNEQTEMQKKNWIEMQKAHKNKHQEARKSPDTVEPEPPCKKNGVAKAKVKEMKKPCEPKVVEVPPYEEETSSTTTESSNNEEVEVKSPKPVAKKPPPAKTPPPPEPEPRTHSRLERRKSQPKTLPKNYNKENRESCERSEVKSEHRHRGSRGVRDRKEKHHSNKKQSEKNANRMSENSSSSSPTIRTSPSQQLGSVWGENKASFSDVVARSEAPPTTAQHRPLVQMQTAKPTMYVEPYKKPVAELGPIGSRRMDYWQESSVPRTQAHVTLQEEQYNQISSNSFFTDSHNLGVESAFLDYGGENWQGSGVSPLMSFFQQESCAQALGNPQQDEGITDPWIQNSTGFWDYTPLEDLQQSQPIHDQNGYLWGSSSVWQPWAPEVTRTPTRTPPGFAPNRDEDERGRQQPPPYNPFGLNNIWNQPNPWNYPQGQ